MGRATAVLFGLAWAAVAGSFPTDGEALFWECEFKAAAHSLEHALTKEPGNAWLHFWLGKSYARMAEVSAPFSARRNARKAQAHLETPARLDPGKGAFLMDLFEFYMDSPEDFEGGLSRATAMLERLGPDNAGTRTQRRIVADARKQYSGPGWALRKAFCGSQELSAT